MESVKKAGKDEILSSFIYFSLINFCFPLSTQNSACIFTKPIAKLAVIAIIASIAALAGIFYVAFTAIIAMAKRL